MRRMSEKEREGVKDGERRRKKKKKRKRERQGLVRLKT